MQAIMNILGIETSCDETAVAIISAQNSQKSPVFHVLSNIVSSQVELHAEFGGVVPNLAAREHAKNMIPCLQEAIETAKLQPEQIDLIAVTRGPGLISALLVGTSAAKSLAYAWQKPIVGVDHIAGHIYANWIENHNIEFPVLCLVVSGGHTELVLMKDYGKFELVGKTRDDAVGEAFDKAARLLDLGYPGGPAISKIAKDGTSGKFSLPRPMIHDKNFDFSFSGLKTAVRELVLSQKNMTDSVRADIAKEFQQATIDVLISKTVKASEKYNPKTIVLAGGVAANKELREQLGTAIQQNMPETKYLMPSMKLCTDNASMIAVAGYFEKDKATNAPWDVETDANITIA